MEKVIVGGILAAAASSLIWLYAHQRTAAPSTHAPRAKTAAPSGERAGEDSPPAPRPSPRPVGQVSPAAPADSAAAAPAPKLLHREVAPYLDVRFKAEPVDPGWARETTMTVRNAVQASLLPGGSLLSAECRSSMCRFEVQVDSVMAGESLVEDLFVYPKGKLHLGPVILPQRVVDADGETKLLAFVAREGGTLPSMEVMPDEP